jgi:ubiquinone/menaquinone biosynthesis C-methylase UbiE
MEGIRKPYQGIWNIVRFNWHFFVFVSLIILALALFSRFVNNPLSLYLKLICFMALLQTLISLFISYYVYDRSDLYTLNWANELIDKGHSNILNIHAGFDETSTLIKNKFPDCTLHVFDFYDQQTHTEISIQRARKAYSVYTNTRQITTAHIPIEDNSVDLIFVTLSAHEIRDDSERNTFFSELSRVLKPSGRIILTEHLRDIANFAAYNIGSFHFLPRKTWLNNFISAQLNNSKEIQTTPLITTFILSKHGTAS